MKRILSAILCFFLIFSGAYAEICVRLDDGSLLLDRSGKEIIPLGVYEDIVPITSELYAAGRDSLYALMDTGGHLLSEFIYTFLEPTGGAIIGESSGMRALLSKDGAPLTPFEYTRIVPVGDGRFWAIKGKGDDLESDELFLLSSNGSEQATGLFARRIQPAGESTLLAVLHAGSGLWGYCNTDGEMVIPNRFSHAGPFLHGRAAVVENGRFGAIDTAGQTVVSAEYDYLEICSGGFILAGRSRQGVWIFDLSGVEIGRYEGEETAAAPVSDGYAVYDGESLTLYSAAGEILTQGVQEASVTEGLNGQFILANGPWGEACVGIVGTKPLYQNLFPLGWAEDRPIYAFMEANSARYINDLLGEIQISVDMESARYGVVNDQGEILIPAEFESISAIGDDRLLCRVDDYWQVMDTKGSVYWAHGIRQIEEPIS